MTRATVAALLLCACAAPGPIRGGDKPAWVSTPNGDVRFPANRFIAAVGSTSVGQKPAPELLASVDAAARAQVMAVLSSSVPDKALVKEFESQIEVPDRWRQGDTAYAWAVFDKQKALAAQQAKVDAHEKTARDLLTQGAALETEKPADALRDYARARHEASAEADTVTLVQALGGAAQPSSVPVEAEQKMSALLGEMVLSVVEGDQQRVADGAALPAPIVITAWLKGKRAVGLPLSASIPGGGRAAGVTIGADGKAEIRVESIGKFEKPEQTIQIAVDWPAVLGVAPDKVPAWIATLPKTAALTAVAYRRGLDTTRVLVLVTESIEGASAPSDAPLAAHVANALKAAGFAEVQNGQSLIDRFGADRIAKMTNAQVCEAARRVADVVVFGSATSHFSSNFGATTVWHKATAAVRAIDVASGAVLFTAPAEEVKSKRPGEPGVAGRSALESLGDAIGPSIGAALKKAAGQP